MQISWLGLSSFEITTKNPNGEVVLIIDPYANTTGLRFPKTEEAHVAIVTHDEADANNVVVLPGHPHLITIPGEFEVRGVFVFGIGAPLKRGKDHVLVRMEIEGIHVVHLGALDRELTDEELTQLSHVDLLMIPVGGNGVLTPGQAAEVITQIEPRVVIPMTYQLPNLKTHYETVEAFCEEMGSYRREEMNKYKVTRKDLPEEDMLIVTLAR